MVIPFNNLDAAEETLSTYGHRIAAVIVEPMMNAGGLVAAKEGYLAGLRKLADKYHVLLIFDEVVTFRLTLGGWQRMEQVMPDITALERSSAAGCRLALSAARPRSWSSSTQPARIGSSILVLLTGTASAW